MTNLEQRYGQNVGEQLPPNEILKEMRTTWGRRVFLVSKPSPGVPTINYGLIGKGVVVVEEEQPSGFFSEGEIHESKLDK